jgi:hypothetical protein
LASTLLWPKPACATSPCLSSAACASNTERVNPGERLCAGGPSRQVKILPGWY